MVSWWHFSETLAQFRKMLSDKGSVRHVAFITTVSRQELFLNLHKQLNSLHGNQTHLQANSFLKLTMRHTVGLDSLLEALSHTD